MSNRKFHMYSLGIRTLMKGEKLQENSRLEDHLRTRGKNITDNDLV